MRFNDSLLVRHLASLAPGVPAPAPADPGVAQRMAQWLNVADAITLHAAQQSVAQTPTLPKAQQGKVAAADLQQALERTRHTLRASITRREKTLDTEYPLYHQRYQDEQRRMEMSVQALREHVRQGLLAQSSPRLAQLVAMDTLLGQMLAAREQRLLAGVPSFLKTRYQQLRTQHQPAAADGPAQALVPVHPQAAWLAQFVNEFEQTLLAELDLRLQPILGLLEALAQE
ncbi:DUF3348 family protein [Ideonella paludis]|uniref:DUF3348 family protein n=1 Tax=Ideonella paludis TaxID=1233411 RepID=A0ABS5DRV0_9BURK|nr:DUF3348 family protein [Ideonella paludis]MBQ0933863.1 DUF3348 family protein [Ideonella paludis]